MRTFLAPLAIVVLVALVGPSHAEFDSAGVGPAKAKTTQSTGATFTDGMAATHYVHVDHTVLRLEGVRRAMAARVWLITTPTLPQPIIKRGSNIPRPRRPADQPLSIDW